MALTPAQKVEFGKYLKTLREGRGLTLRQVQDRADIAPGYLSLVEVGSRNPPSREYLIRLARLYEVSPKDMLSRAGRAGEDAEEDLEADAIRRAYEFVINDKRFESGHSLSGEPDLSVMRFMVEMYEKGTGLRLLGGRQRFNLDEEE